MDQITGLYVNFLDLFPPALHPLISIIVAIAIIYSLIQVIRKDWIYLIVLVVLLPASLPILRNVAQMIFEFIKFLLPG